jgi:CheY-like chemotaxis protein
VENPRILSVGQCGFDGARLRRELGSALGAEVVAADTHDEARDLLRQAAFDLVLINRVGDLDGAPGLDLIRSLKADAATAPVPVMLVSNYADAQDEAIRAGAAPGFGKADLGAPRALVAIRRALGATAAS